MSKPDPLLVEVSEMPWTIGGKKEKDQEFCVDTLVYVQNEICIREFPLATSTSNSDGNSKSKQSVNSGCDSTSSFSLEKINYKKITRKEMTKKKQSNSDKQICHTYRSFLCNQMLQQ